jgi:hypothetical protein
MVLEKLRLRERIDKGLADFRIRAANGPLRKNAMTGGLYF